MGINVKAETLKLLVENIRENLCILRIIKDLLDNTGRICHKTKP